MKTLFTFLSLFIFLSANAEIYETKSKFKSFSNEYSYQFKSLIDLDVVKVDIFKKTAILLINGSEKEVALKELNSRVWDHEFYATYELVIAKDILTSGSGCEEAESVTYKTVFNLEMALYNNNMFQVAFKNVEAIQNYSADICHDFSPKRIKFEYSKK